MKKAEYIAKYGEEAYKAHIEKVNARYKQKRTEILKQAKTKYKKNRTEILEQRNLKYHTDTEYREIQKARNRDCCKRRWQNDENFRKAKSKENVENNAKNYLKNLHEELGSTYKFVRTQYSEYSRKKINNWKEYIYDILKTDAALDGDVNYLSEDFLYEKFLDNKENDLYYGNIKIVKYFIPLMCIKIYDNEIFNDREVEMLNYFKTFKNITKKKPVKYSDKVIWMPKEYLHNAEKATEIMKLYNIVADFMLNAPVYE